ncbi:Retrotrans gag domain-containing protein [Abeliophyllum distichum]|uniref:Retrotrans gag domain-containing protein n=1 Tax=Abeliophyllum distichum TaxID=126358 RepID=A0ABD1RTA5_9LAMI
MGRKIEDVMSKKSGRQQSLVLKEDHFVPKVMVVSLSRYFEQPKMEKYDGSFDSADHLKAFVDLMRLRVTPDVIMCRALSPTLRWEAMDWVATLPPKSIRTFDDFLSSLLHTFLATRGLRK